MDDPLSTSALSPIRQCPTHRSNSDQRLNRLIVNPTPVKLLFYFRAVMMSVIAIAKEILRKKKSYPKVMLVISLAKSITLSIKVRYLRKRPFFFSFECFKQFIE